MGERTFTVALTFVATVRASDEIEAGDKAREKFEEVERHAGLFDGALSEGISEFGERELDNEFTRTIHTIDALLRSEGFEPHNEQYLQGEQTINYRKDNLLIHVAIMESD